MKQKTYTSIIFDATNCAAMEIPLIEDIMRNDIFHSTLDWQTEEQLTDAARQAFCVIRPYPCMKCGDRFRTVEDMQKHQDLGIHLGIHRMIRL